MTKIFKVLLAIAVLILLIPFLLVEMALRALERVARYALESDKDD